MRIGLVIEHFDPRRGGAEMWTCQFARRLARLGHEVHAIARDIAPSMQDAGLIFEPVRAGSSRVEFATAAEAVARRLNLDVVHDNGDGWYGDLLLPHAGIREAMFEQQLLIEPRWLRPFKRLAARWLPRYREFKQVGDRQYGDPRRIYLAISQMLATNMRQYHNVPASQIRLVYNGIDTARFAPDQIAEHRQSMRAKLDVRDGEVLLLIVAINFRRKGVPTLLRATARLAQQGLPVRAVVVGGKRLAPWQRQLDRLGIAERVTLVGHVDDPRPYYGAADAYVLPTFYDPCSLVVLEALACGLPVVTSRFNGAGELITPGQEGYIVADPADDAELATALTPLFDAEHRASLGAAARQLALDHALERNCREILAVYDEIVARRAVRAA
ncbi:MAG: glycosyltransferase family 4 protein [Planctomycetes bacterium]|nr:glycosyltransferase family 4 protein [Planctomycetota bacterium]